MTAVGYDAVTLGNHEFDYGWREILAYRDIADFPLLSANARGPAGELIADAPFATLILEDLRVGIVGVTTQGSCHHSKMGGPRLPTGRRHHRTHRARLE